MDNVSVKNISQILMKKIFSPIFSSAKTIGVKKTSGKTAEFFIGLLTIILVTGIYATALANKDFPVAEGWYTQYSDMINNGSIPYRDFEYLFFPLYLYIMAAITAVFGYNIIVLRIVGVLLFVGIGIVSYLIFYQCFDAVAATAAGCVTTMFLQSEVVQIFYDYIRFMDFFIYLAVLFIIKTMLDYVKDNERKFSINAMFAGLFSAAACMVKQSCGILFICYCIVLFVFMLLIYENYKKTIIYAITYILSCAIPIGMMLGYLKSVNALDCFLDLTLSGAASAKGGIATILFAWIFNLFGASSTFMPSVLLIIGFILINMWFTTQYPSRRLQVNKKSIIIFSAVSVAFLSFCLIFENVAEYFNSKVISNTPTIIYVTVAITFIVIGLYYIFVRYFDKKKNTKFIIETLPFFALLGSVFAIGYGSGTSGGLVESQTALSIGVLIAVALQFAQHYYASIIRILLLGFACGIICVTCSRKIVVPYSWWGQTSEKIWAQTESVDVPLLEGIKVSSERKAMYEGIYNLVQTYSGADDYIYTFPQIPIFYKLCERKTESYTQVQWFDVSTENGIYKDMTLLCENAPKMFIYCDVPEEVELAHESAFNSNKVSQERIMSNFIEAFTEKNEYILLDSFNVSGGYNINVYVASDNTAIKTSITDYGEFLPEGTKYKILHDLSQYLPKDYKEMEFYVEQAGNYYNALDRKIPSELNNLTISAVNSAFNDNASGFIINLDMYKNILKSRSNLRERIAKNFTFNSIDEKNIVFIKSSLKNLHPDKSTEYSFLSGSYGIETNSDFDEFSWVDKNAQLLICLLYTSEAETVFDIRRDHSNR